MAKTIAQLRTEAQTIKNETNIGANTATRVGGFGEDIVDYLEDNPSSGGTFATGEEVGDVSLFDALSDLDGKTTEQKHAMIPDGNAVDEIYKVDVLVDIDGYMTKNCSLGTSTWYMNNEKGRHKAIPVEEGDAFRLISTSWYGWLTSSYNPDVQPTNGQTIPYVSGTGRLTVDGGDGIITAPQGAAYLCITAVDGGGATISNTLYHIMPRYDHVDEEIYKLSDDVAELYLEEILDTDVPLENYYIGTNYKWSESSTYKCKIFDVSKHKGDKVIIERYNGKICRYAFLIDTQKSDVAASFCIGTSLVEPNAPSVTDIVPLDANYLYLYASSAGTDVTPIVKFVKSALEFSVGDDFVRQSKIDISLLTPKNCIMVLGATTWYMDSGNTGRHIAYPVVAGEIYRISYTESYGGGRFGLLSSDYDPSTTYQSGSTCPYVTGTKSYNVSSDSNDSVIIKIPLGCAYICLNAEYQGKKYTWTLEKGIIKECENDPATNILNKFRIAHWNVGHFSWDGSTTSYDTRITHDNYEEMKRKWAIRLNAINADIMLTCEYNTNFVNASGSLPAITAREAIFLPDIWAYGYVGSKPYSGSYMQTAMFSNMPLHKIKQVVFPQTVQSGRYYQVGEFYVGNKVVKVVETHLDFNQGQSGHDYRQLQIQKLISDFANDDYVIIGADFNTNNCTESPQEDEYAPFKAAGYNMINWGALGYIMTFMSGDNPTLAIDNIVCKGLTVNNINIVNDVELTDHCCIYADFTLIV